TTFAAVLGLALVCSCSHAADQSPGSQISPQAGHIIGTAKTADDKPLKAFIVLYSGFQEGKLANTFADGNLIETISNKVDGHDGKFDIQVPPGAYRVSSFVTCPFHGREYNFELEPLNAPVRHDYNRLG